MDDIIALQKETLKSVSDYLDNLIPAMHNVCSELSGEEKEDTWEYLRMILDGFNWVVEAYNGTSSYINQNGEVINTAKTDASVAVLSKAYLAKDGAATALAIENEIIPFLTTLKKVAEEI